MSVREYLRTRLGQVLSSYEIDRISDISDIEKPSDITVAKKAFHQRNFVASKHSLVVKLRTRI